MVKFKTDPSNDAPEGTHHVTWGEGGGTRKVQFQTPPALKIVGNFYYGFVGGTHGPKGGKGGPPNARFAPNGRRVQRRKSGNPRPATFAMFYHTIKRLHRIQDARRMETATTEPRGGGRSVGEKGKESMRFLPAWERGVRGNQANAQDLLGHLSAGGQEGSDEHPTLLPSRTAN